jgi:hypothetical protein
MDRLCGQVNLLLSVNKELSARLRNLEHQTKPQELIGTIHAISIEPGTVTGLTAIRSLSFPGACGAEACTH